MIKMCKELFEFSQISFGLTCLATFLFILFIKHFLITQKNLPPGPWGVPILGYWPFLKNNNHILLTNLGNKYGDIYSINIGRSLVIVLSSFRSIKEALVKQRDNFAARPAIWQTQLKSISSTEGEIWKSYKRFSLSTLRDFGIGKLSLEPRVKEEIEFLLKLIEDFKGQATDLGDVIRMSVSNVICSIIFGKRFEYEDEQFHRLLVLINKTFSVLGLDTITQVRNSFLMNNPLIKWFLRKRSSMLVIDKLRKETSKIVNSLNEVHVPGSQDNFINAWLTEAKARPNQKYFTIEDLFQVVFSLFVAGTDTTSNAIRWSLLYLMHNPDIQARIHKEIDDVIGKERTPSITDRDLMPYTEATINEVQRLSSLVPLSLVHSNFEEANLLGYQIPKRSIIIPNLWAVHHDPEIYPEPDKFKPERFLDENGKLIKSEKLIPFSMGMRQCLGESLARMELFLYFTSLFQKFEFQKPDDGESNISFDYIVCGIILIPKPFNVRAKLRT